MIGALVHDDAGRTHAPIALDRSVWAVRDDILPLVASGQAREMFAARPSRAFASAGTSHAGGSVAVLSLSGLIMPRASYYSVGLDEFLSEFQEAVDSSEVSAIVIEVDSPGGLIDLVPETAAAIRAARGSKPIVAVASTQAASAAYWIAAQADEVVVTPSGDVGSIGVFMIHRDYSGFNAQMGVQPTYIAAGKYKVEGNPDSPLGDEARAAWQADVQDLYGLFVADVSAGRGVSEEAVMAGYGEGRTLLAARALAEGMVDRIATLDEVISGLLGAPARVRPASARAAAVIDKPDVSASDEDAPQEDPADDAPEEEEEEEEEEEVPSDEVSPEDRAAIALALIG